MADCVELLLVEGVLALEKVVEDVKRAELTALTLVVRGHHKRDPGVDKLIDLEGYFFQIEIKKCLSGNE